MLTPHFSKDDAVYHTTIFNTKNIAYGRVPAAVAFLKWLLYGYDPPYHNLPPRAVCTPTLTHRSRDFKYLPSEIKGRVMNVLHEAVGRIAPALGGEGGNGKGGRSARGGGRRGSRQDEEAQSSQQGQAELPLRNAFKMSVYLLFSAAFPSEEYYSSAKQVCVPPKYQYCSSACSSIRSQNKNRPYVPLRFFNLVGVVMMMAHRTARFICGLRSTHHPKAGAYCSFLPVSRTSEMRGIETRAERTTTDTRERKYCFDYCAAVRRK